LLRDADSANKSWDEAKIKEAIASENEQTIPLRENVPIMIRYRTAWVDEQGNVNLRPDVYDFDAKLAKMLRY
ncbi:MAG TPA: murein L,D-transpeptidase, partial [bacterium]|nr:murein L,D-transpeptidase [bacterium]